MNALDKLEALTRTLNEARAYLGMIGKTQPHTTARVDGYLVHAKVETQIHFQYNDGAQNYHGSKEFDRVFSDVVKENFKSLADATMRLLEQEVEAAKVAAKEEYARRFGEVLDQPAAVACIVAPAP